MTILILKDVRENLQLDLQSAKLHKFMAITEPLAKDLSDRASGLSTVAQSGPVCAALMISRSMNLRKLDSLRYAFCDPDFL